MLSYEGKLMFHIKRSLSISVGYCVPIIKLVIKKIVGICQVYKLWFISLYFVYCSAIWSVDYQI